MHNGQIGNFHLIRRQLEASLSDELYDVRRGTTDSELLFLLLLQNGLVTQPKQAIERVFSILENVQLSTNQPNRLTCVLSDGANLYAFRHSCDRKSPTLYLSKQSNTTQQVIASEPLDGNVQNWIAMPEDQFIFVLNGKTKMEPFKLSKQLS